MLDGSKTIFSMSDETPKTMLVAEFDTELMNAFSRLQTFASYKLSQHDEYPFLYFHRYITQPQPEFITVWRSDVSQIKWYEKLTNGVLVDVQNAFACVVYHYDNIKLIELEFRKVLENIDYKSLGNHSVSGGNTLRLDFEYQAFVLSLRRCLDYSAIAFGAYFRQDFRTYRKVSKILESLPPTPVTHSLISAHRKSLVHFEFAISNGDRKSQRDKISHYEYVPAGVLNLSGRGISIAGGGQSLWLEDNKDLTSLEKALLVHVNNLRSYLTEMIIGFVDAAKIHHAVDV